MFYYLSFLRPPPLSASLSISTKGKAAASSIIIIPQIANDLRTEYYDGPPLDIMYQWIRASSADALKTSPTKLTSYRAETMYKEIIIPLPKQAKEGDEWILMLSAASDTTGEPSGIVDLSARVHPVPLPVYSMPIQITRSFSPSKQEKLMRQYIIPSRPCCIRVMEQTSFDLDKKIWDSGIGLSSWLVEIIDGQSSVTNTHASNLRRLLDPSRCCRVVELGAGTGIVSLVLAALRYSVPVSPSDTGVDSFPSDPELDSIFTTDLSSAMSLLEQNIALNEHLFSPSRRLRAIVLDWDNSELPLDIRTVGFDVIIMADVTYNIASFLALLRTLKSFIQLGAGPNSNAAPLIVLGYKERHLDERVLWEMARSIGVLFHEVDARPGAGGQPVEIWIGTIFD
ncbi:hypothetical protein FISHEDRAFT_69426 [Fistulina hepatica ATCC 64428]|uniref:Methyltransferase-domain-containing protein n=1 Tax=Fistulina hepatica ATCC 64428 TaxID=1128425 RepID=A0A0D7AN09_9AGAR|nr:hypothetical protein FISHEDRAFT_69426 [Fistulina hepatica ATCC 64428]